MQHLRHANGASKRVCFGAIEPHALDMPTHLGKAGSLAARLTMEGPFRGVIENMTSMSPSVPESGKHCPTDVIDLWVEALCEFSQLPGLALCVVRGQEIGKSLCYGYSNLDTKQRVTSTMRFPIASLSKMVTAIAILQLRDAGALDLEDSLSDHLPWFRPVLAGTTPNSPTIKAALTHTAGLPCGPDRVLWKSARELSPDSEDLRDRAGAIQQSAETGKRHNYSNLGYALLGEIIAERSGTAYEDWIREHILHPLGMFSTGPTMSDTGQDHAMGYTKLSRTGSRRPIRVPHALSLAMAPAGGLSSTLEDMAAFAKWQIRTLRGDDDAILTAATLREMQSTAWQSPEWGLGFSIWNVNGDRFVGHQGGTPGFGAFFALCPEKETAVVAMGNAHDFPSFSLAFGGLSLLDAFRPGAVEDRVQIPGADFAGFYHGETAWADAIVMPWDGSLALLWLDFSGLANPTGSIVQLQQVEPGVSVSYTHLTLPTN